MNWDPCVGLVSTFAAPINAVSLCMILNMPLSTCSDTQKYLILICFVLIDVDLPAFTMSIVDILSWNMVAGEYHILGR